MTKNKKLMIIFSVVIVLAVLIILNSVIFSVQHVNAVCRNDDDIELDAIIESNHGIRYGSSIFSLNEEKTTEKVMDNLLEKGVANITVLDIVRTFPNRVVIHYVKTVDYFYVLQNGNAYYFSNKSSTLTSIKQENEPKGNTLELKIKGELTSLEIGQAFSSTEALEAERVATLLSAFERTEGLPYSSLRNYFYFVDISYDSIFIATDRGVYLQFVSMNNFIMQFETGLSAYIKYRDDPNPEEKQKAREGNILLNEYHSTAIYDRSVHYPG